MKRERDEEVEERDLLREEYVLFLTARRGSKDRLFISENPNRLKFSLFELSFFLNLDATARRTSWRYLERVKGEVNYSVPDLFCHAISAIWMANVSIGTVKIGMSVLLNALPRVTTTITRSGHLLYEPDFFVPFLDRIYQAVRDNGSPAFLPEIEKIQKHYKLHWSLFKSYTRVFSTLINFDLNLSDNTTKLSNNEFCPLQDVFRFGWLFLLHVVGSVRPASYLSCCIWCTAFLASQICESFLRPLDDGISNLISAASIAGVSQEANNITLKWTISQTPLLCSWFKQDLASHQSTLNFVRQSIQEFRNHGFLKSLEAVGNPDYEWNLFPMALDNTAQGLLQANLQALIARFDEQGKGKFGIDLLSFVPLSKRGIETPIYFNRTPGMSVMSKALGRNLSKAPLSLGSGIQKNMLKTSRFTTGYTGPRIPTTLVSCQQMLSDISKLLDIKRIESYEFKSSLPEGTEERMQKIIEPIAATFHHFKWDLTIQLYYGLLQKILELGVTISGQVVPFLKFACNSSFNRTILCVSLEIIRFVQDPDQKSLSFDYITQKTNILFVELTMLIKLMLDNVITVPKWPRYIVKRLSSLHERLLESDMWSDPSLYSFLRLSQPSNQENFSISSIMEFSALVSPNLSTLMLHGHSFSHLDQNRFKAYLELYTTFFELAKTRLEEICTHPTLNISAGGINASWNLFVKCMMKEHESQLLSNRHMDVLIICCILAATHLDNENCASNLQDILEVYFVLPQYLRTTIYSIYISKEPGSQIKICDFYQRIFLPVIGKVKLPDTQSLAMRKEVH